MLPIEQSCFWLATRGETTAASRLDRDTRCDVAILGGGLTGLWTALSLKQLAPATEVVLLEAETVGYGASGRNAGMLSETIDHTHALAIQHFGVDQARQLALLGQRNVDEMVTWLRERGIDCDLELSGRMMVALTEGQLADCERAVATAVQLGVTNHRLLNAEETQSQLHSPLYLGGVRIAGGGILNPVKLVDGLLREAERLGVRVFDKTRAGSIRRNANGVAVHAAPCTLHPAPVVLQAARVVLATNAYSHHLVPRLLHRFIPLYDYILVSEPLPAERLRTLGWDSRQGVTDLRTFFNYYRLTRDNRILWGTSEAAYYRGNSVDPAHDHSPEHYASLQESFHRHFPQFGPVEFPYRWGGPIASTTRMTPFFGSFEDGRILYGLGYTGHGLGSTRLAGRILAHLALQRPSELSHLRLVSHRPLPYPPEPFRGYAVSAVTRALRRVDRGEPPGRFLRLLDMLGIGFSS
jgi:glycine/D-amino acid oxidase-like deaminating enzyme